MKKLISYIAASVLAFAFTSCLDLEPTSTITNRNYWKNPGQVEAFNQGLSSLVRSYAFTYIQWGEMRSNIYGGRPFSGENTAGFERMWNNTLTQSNPQVSNYGGLHTAINQINLLIDNMANAPYLTEAQRLKYLARGYGMRAFLYFHLLRSYGNVIINTTHTEGSQIELNNVAHAQNTAAEVLAQIKADIKASEDAYGNNFAFTDGRTYWSLAATKMLKGEVYLWSGKQMGGGNADYQTALEAYQSVQSNADVQLLTNFDQVFAFNNKENREIIFALHNRTGETALWGGAYTYLVMNKQNVGGYRLHYTPDSIITFDKSQYLNLSHGSGTMFISLNRELWNKLYFNANDKRKSESLADVYGSDGTSYRGNIANKFHGTLLTGASNASWLDDQPIYRFAECLLGIAEAKVLLGQDPATEINAIRRRAYGAAYFNANPNVQYPNETATSAAAYYNNNPFVGGDEDPEEAVLKERFREFLFEGKRWYDIRLFGKATKYSTANERQLLWPIDEKTLSTNSKLVQTSGYEVK